MSRNKRALIVNISIITLIILLILSFSSLIKKHKSERHIIETKSKYTLKIDYPIYHIKKGGSRNK